MKNEQGSAHQSRWKRTRNFLLTILLGLSAILLICFCLTTNTRRLAQFQTEISYNERMIQQINRSFLVNSFELFRKCIFGLTNITICFRVNHCRHRNTVDNLFRFDGRFLARFSRVRSKCSFQ